MTSNHIPEQGVNPLASHTRSLHAHALSILAEAEVPRTGTKGRLCAAESVEAHAVRVAPGVSAIAETFEPPPPLSDASTS